MGIRTFTSRRFLHSSQVKYLCFILFTATTDESLPFATCRTRPNALYHIWVYSVTMACIPVTKHSQYLERVHASESGSIKTQKGGEILTEIFQG